MLIHEETSKKILDGIGDIINPILDDCVTLSAKNKQLRKVMQEIIDSPLHKHVPNWVIIKLEQTLKE